MGCSLHFMSFDTKTERGITMKTHCCSGRLNDLQNGACGSLNLRHMKVHVMPLESLSSSLALREHRGPCLLLAITPWQVTHSKESLTSPSTWQEQPLFFSISVDCKSPCSRGKAQGGFAYCITQVCTLIVVPRDT